MEIAIIGMGPGNPDLLTGAAQDALKKSTALFGDARILEHVDTEGKTVVYTTRPSEIQQHMATLPPHTRAAIAVSGDVGFFSLAACIKDIPGCTIRRYPGISSLVYLAAALSISWQDAYVVSRHGRRQPLIHAVMTHGKVFCLTGGDSTPGSLCRELVCAGFGYVRVCVGERLSYADERIVEGTAETLQGEEFAPLNAMFIFNDHAKPLTTPVHGLDDSLFVRGNVPMTKQEIRAVAIAKLRPQPEDCLYDIGAGTGSCTVEMARQVPFGHVYAFEMNEEALSLIRQNTDRFRTDNVTVLPGNAAETLQTDIPAPQGVFIGGTKGNLAPVLDEIYAKNPACRIVITAVTIETLAAITAYYKEKKEYTLDMVQISAAVGKPVGAYHLMTAHNPVYIITSEVRP